MVTSVVLFPPPFYFFKSQTSYRTYKIISSYELARPIMGTIFLVNIYMCVCRMSNHVNQTRACSKSVLGGKIRPVTSPYYSFRLYARAALVWTEEKRSLRNEKLKANRAS